MLVHHTAVMSWYTWPVSQLGCDGFAYGFLIYRDPRHQCAKATK